METKHATLYARLLVAGVMMLVSLVIVGCQSDDDDGDGGSGGSSTPTQVDRMAIPGVNTALVSSALKNNFNQGDPSTDTAEFGSEVETNITNLRSAVSGVLGPEDSPGITPAQLTAVIIPDVVTIDFSAAVQFPNGRQLDDDVMDAVLGLVLNRGDPLGAGAGIPDSINANDVAFGTTFPYLAQPQ